MLLPSIFTLPVLWVAAAAALNLHPPHPLLHSSPVKAVPDVLGHNDEHQDLNTSTFPGISGTQPAGQDALVL